MRLRMRGISFRFIVIGIGFVRVTAIPLVQLNVAFDCEFFWFRLAASYADILDEIAFEDRGNK